MLLRVGHLAVEIKPIHQLEHLLEHLPLGTVQLAGVLPAAQHQHQVVVLAEIVRTAEHFHQGRDVLAVVGATDRQHRRLGGIAQKRLQQRFDGGFVAVRIAVRFGRMELMGIHAGGNHPGLGHPKAAVASVLMLQFLTRAGDHQVGVGEGEFLGVDAPRHGGLLIDLAEIQTGSQQATTLLPPQGMAGEHQGKAETTAQEGADEARIGVVGMDPIGKARLGQQGFGQGVGQFLQVGPEQFLAQIAARTEGKPTDGQIGFHPLQGLGVVAGNTAIVDQPGDHLHPLHLRTGGQATGQLQDIDGLAAGVGITAELQVMAAKQAMEVEVEKV